MNWKKRIVNWVFKEEYQRIRQIAQDISSDYQMVPYVMARQQNLGGMLAELDQQSYDFMLRMIRDYQVVSGGDTSDRYRESIVKQSRALYLSDPLVQFSIELWTDYAFSSRPNLTAEDKQAQAVWNEFFNSDRNAPLFAERELHTLSEDELKDGELFFAFYASTVDGETTCRTVPTEEIKEIITDPGDSRVVLYYRRDFNGLEGLEVVYYPDWHASKEQLKAGRAKLPQGAKLANEINPETLEKPGTDVVMLQAAYRKINKRGWPLATAGMDWEAEYSQFMKNRAAVAKAAASVVEKFKVKGGQRAVDAVKAFVGSSIPGSTDSFERNPPPVAGSAWFENDAVNREWMNRPTGAADAEKDGLPLLTYVGLAFKLYPHYLGRGEAYRLATATAMEGPTLRSFNRYASFWSSIWRDMFKIITGFAEQYGNKSFSSREATVSTDRIISLSTDDIGKAATALNDMVDRAIIDSTTAQAVGRVLIQTELETIGVQGVDEIMNPKPVTETFFTPERAKEVFEAWLEASKGKGAGESRSPFRGG